MPRPKKKKKKKKKRLTENVKQRRTKYEYLLSQK